MILTWVFRALFVPLLVLAIVTSNCNAARAPNIESPRASVPGNAASSAGDGTEMSVVVRIPLTDKFAVDVHFGYLWGDARGFVADVSGGEPDSDVCFDVRFELRPIGHAAVAADNFDCRDAGTATARVDGPARPL